MSSVSDFIDEAPGPMKALMNELRAFVTVPEVHESI